MNLTGNTILITGGTSGIGYEFAKELLKKGNKIIVTGRNQQKLDKVKSETPELITIQNDISKIENVNSLFAQVTSDYPDTNILINNAGFARTINYHDENENFENITSEIETNLMGPVRLIKKFITHLKSKPNSAIVNVTSGLAFVPLPTMPVYCATKAALHSFSLSLRVQLKNTSIKVFEVAPPATQTELLGAFDEEDMKGISIMTVQKMVAESISGMEHDRFEIRPGQANQLKFMSRLAPNFILNQLSRPVDRMLRGQQH